MEGVGLVSFFCEYEEDEFWAGDSGFGGFLMDDLGRGITGGVLLRGRMCEMYVGGAVAVGLFKGFCLFGML